MTIKTPFLKLYVKKPDIIAAPEKPSRAKKVFISKVRLKQKKTTQSLLGKESRWKFHPAIFSDQPTDNQAALELLESWLLDDADELEQRETWEYLKQVLDEDRLSYRKLFP